MKKITTLLLLFPLLISAQWKGVTSNDDQRTMMIQRHMNLYPQNDQSQLKNIFMEASTINVNGTIVTPTDLAEFEKILNKIFKIINLQFQAKLQRLRQLL